MAKQMYTLRDVPKYENIRAAAARYPELDPSSSAAFILLLRVASDFLAATDDYLAGHGLSHGRFTTLMLLYRTIDVPQNPCELARKAGVTRATMTGLLDGLEREHFITRKTVPADRRMLEVALSATGTAFLEKVMPGYFRLVRKCMGGLSQEEREGMIALLTKLGATADIHTAPLPEAVPAPN
jgi:DNA-binding MarR family transcriptional regulator